MTTPTQISRPFRPGVLQQRSTLAAVRKRRRLVRDALAAVEAASNAQTSMLAWQDRLSAALVELLNAYETHVADGLDPMGSLSEIAFREPQLAPDVAQIQRKQAQLLGRIEAVAAHVATGTRLQLRDDVADVLADLMACRGATADLFFACYCIDLTREQ